MKKEVRTVVYDDELRIEAYRFEGIVQPFPNHFHEYYVIGFVEDGERILSCKHQAYAITKGDVLLFNPGDSHACVQSDGGTLDYRGFNITREVMLNLAEEVTGRREPLGFSHNVISDEEVTCSLRPLHELVMKGSPEFGKEEHLLLLISLLIQRYGHPFESGVPECREEIEQALYGANLFGTDVPLCRIEQIHPASVLYQGKGHYPLPLSGKYTRWQCQKTVGTGRSPR